MFTLAPLLQRWARGQAQEEWSEVPWEGACWANLSHPRITFYLWHHFNLKHRSVSASRGGRRDQGSQEGKLVRKHTSPCCCSKRPTSPYCFAKVLKSRPVQTSLTRDPASDALEPASSPGQVAFQVRMPWSPGSWNGLYCKEIVCFFSVSAMLILASFMAFCPLHILGTFSRTMKWFLLHPGTVTKLLM